MVCNCFGNLQLHRGNSGHQVGGDAIDSFKFRPPPDLTRDNAPKPIWLIVELLVSIVHLPLRASDGMVPRP